MTWKERRTITILSSILAILSAALLIVLGMKYRESLAAGEDPAAQAAENAAAAGSAYTSLSYSNGSASLSFSLDEAGKWIWDDDPDFPLDDTVLTAIASTLAGLTPQQALSNPEAPESYQLDDPTAAITATAPDGSTVSISFGKSTTDGQSYYAMMNGDSSAIYIFDGTLLGYLQTPIYDMMQLPELPELTEETLLSITIRGAASAEGAPGTLTVLTAQRPEDGGADTTWRCDGANVTDDPTVQALLEDFTQLTIAKCVDYRPSAEAAAICGFDAPAAQVAVAYRSGGGEQTLSLAIGVPLPDGSGRYARVGEDTTIYLLETALLDPLMRVAANGLEP
ncbi:DUF4340 domain-containing protein [uncultured Oscillibacter sp.]|uniref:DUF4340 domain-containing protein n=1 Tax=uncultured Oscillibacter sp. TaxID=876091 RepID=UPI0025EC3E1B|nr:DUF4340 domain-containing protein [uncultured Oscillibacter sp.]